MDNGHNTYFKKTVIPLLFTVAREGALIAPVFIKYLLAHRVHKSRQCVSRLHLKGNNFFPLITVYFFLIF